jgi:hypothetical protein
MDHTIERERTEKPSAFDSRLAWKGGLAAGVAASVAMGVAISAVRLSTLQMAIAGLYGLEGNLVAGWATHVVHGALFGLVFAAILADPGVYGITTWRWKTAVAGAVYGVVLAVVGAGVVMPMWLEVVGFAAPPSIPNVTVPLLAWHLVYGVVLGAVFPSVEDL